MYTYLSTCMYNNLQARVRKPQQKVRQGCANHQAVACECVHCSQRITFPHVYWCSDIYVYIYIYIRYIYTYDIYMYGTHIICIPALLLLFRMFIDALTYAYIYIYDTYIHTIYICIYIYIHNYDLYMYDTHIHIYIYMYSRISIVALDIYVYTDTFYMYMKIHISSCI